MGAGTNHPSQKASYDRQGSLEPRGELGEFSGEGQHRNQSVVGISKTCEIAGVVLEPVVILGR
jgi:hypothetical protein